jgi:hypothetical protein
MPNFFFGAQFHRLQKTSHLLSKIHFVANWESKSPNLPLKQPVFRRGFDIVFRSGDKIGNCSKCSIEDLRLIT